MKHPVSFSLSEQALEDIQWLAQDTGISKTAIVELAVQVLRRLWTTPLGTTLTQTPATTPETHTAET